MKKRRHCVAFLMMGFGFSLCLLVVADHYHFWSPKMAAEPPMVDFIVQSAYCFSGQPCV